MQLLEGPEPDIVTLPPEGDEGMAPPSNKERFDGIEERLGQIEIALNLTPPKPRTPFQTFRDDVIRKIQTHWKTVLPTAALCLTVIGWFVAPLIKHYLEHRHDFINRMIADDLGAKGGINDKLEQIQQTVTSTKATLDALQPFIHDVIQHQFENASKLPTAALQQRLPAIQHLAAIAKDQGVKVDPKVLILLSRKLSAVNTGAVGFWPTAAEFISYRSQQMKDWQETNLPLCDDQFHKALVVKAEKGSNVIIHGPVEVHDCKIILDSVSTSVKLSIDLSIASVNFRRCAVFYSGGPVVIFPVKMAEKTPPKLVGTLHFYDCIFVFSLSRVPPLDGQRLTRSLLAATSNTVKVGPS